jgi:hypothetical protein
MTASVSEIEKFVVFVDGLKSKRRYNPHKILIKTLVGWNLSFPAALWIAYQLKEEEIPYFQNFKRAHNIDGDSIKKRAIEKLKIPPHKVDGLFKQNTYYSVILEIKQIIKDYSTEKFVVKTLSWGQSKIVAISLMTREDFDKLLPSWNSYRNYFLDPDGCKVIIDEYPLSPFLNGILD